MLFFRKIETLKVLTYLKEVLFNSNKSKIFRFQIYLKGLFADIPGDSFGILTNAPLVK